ncbi:HNH endonuclease [Mycobacterium sp. Root135]|nr:HNH endonuclease [Mycobacterium sp. Root135]
MAGHPDRARLLSEWRATLIVRESACLDVADRRVLDARMCADQNSLEGKGDKRIEADAKAIAYELDPHAVVDRAARAETERSVWVRPAPDNMTYVTALLPMPQGVSVYAALRREADTCGDGRPRNHVMADTLVERITGRVYAALRREADTCGDGRPRNHVMADTLVERITGRPADIPVPIAVDLVITDDTLLGGDQAAARVPGYGPIPAGVARRLVNRAANDARSRATVRRLYRHPRSGALVAMESKARIFPKGLAKFLDLRDDTCRTPYCDAPIRHHDHARPHSRDGPTSALNGLGECAHCNYTKEAPGWSVITTANETGCHTAEFTTPTGARHRSVAPRMPGRQMTLTLYSALEVRTALAVSGHAA